MTKAEIKKELQYVNEKVVSERTGLAIPTLRNYRCLGIGPDYVKAGGRAVRYRLDDVIDWMEQGRVTLGPKK